MKCAAPAIGSELPAPYASAIKQADWTIDLRYPDGVNSLEPDFKDAINLHIDELSEIMSLWENGRARGKTPKGVRAGIVHICKAISDETKTRRPAKPSSP